MGPFGKCLPVLCPCVCIWEAVWRPGKREVKWSVLPGNNESLYISKNNGGREERERMNARQWEGHSSGDISHVEYLCTVCLLWQQTQTMWIGREEFTISQKVVKHTLNTLVMWTLGLAWMASLAGKTEVDPVLRSFIPVGSLNKCYASAPTLHGPFVPRWLIIRDSDNFCVFRGTESVRRFCQGSRIHVVLYDWSNPLATFGLTY